MATLPQNTRVIAEKREVEAVASVKVQQNFNDDATDTYMYAYAVDPARPEIANTSKGSVGFPAQPNDALAFRPWVPPKTRQPASGFGADSQYGDARAVGVHVAEQRLPQNLKKQPSGRGDRATRPKVVCGPVCRG